ICRVWSTEWLRNRRAQVERVLEAVLEAQTAPAPLSPPPPRPRPRTETESAARERAQSNRAEYDSIDDVPEDVLRDELVRVLGEWGATPQSELIPGMTKALGFRRTGPKIQRRIEEAIAALQEAGLVSRMADDRLSVTSEQQSIG